MLARILGVRDQIPDRDKQQSPVRGHSRGIPTRQGATRRWTIVQSPG
jgi:hypothetical protein